MLMRLEYARQVANQFFEGRWILKRVNGKDCQQFLRPRFEAACDKLFRILHCLLGVNDFPIHHSSAFVLVNRGSAMPALMDSRMPGTASRCQGFLNCAPVFRGQQHGTIAFAGNNDGLM